MTLEEKDRKYIWHPYTQVQTAGPNIPIVKGEGSHLIAEDGKHYIDAVSSWWVNTHGHAHPHVAKEVSKQLHTLEHTIFAGFTHPKAVELAERLVQVTPENQKKIFFSDNGSTAVEVALKMAFQYWHNKGEQRTRVLAVDGAYHGDTFGAMSVSERGAFTAPFTPFLFDVVQVDFPDSENEDSVIDQVTAAIEGNDIAALIIEPLVQGASGMRMYSVEFLQKLMHLCRENDVLIIADEVFTGFGRTGKFFAVEHVNVQPDIMCLSKGLTAGTMALGVTTCTEEIFNAFLSEDKLKTFFHGHSFTGNPVACAAACASLDLFEDEETWSNIQRITHLHEKFRDQLIKQESVKYIRQQGTILAFELVSPDQTSYFNQIRDQAYDFFIERGILLRPLGNVLYIVPPYCTTDEDMEKVYQAIMDFLNKLS